MAAAASLSIKSTNSFILCSGNNAKEHSNGSAFTVEKHNPPHLVQSQNPRCSAMSPPVENSCPSSAPPSPSEILRARGNCLDKQVAEGGFCLTIQREKLEHALRLYNEALASSVTVDEKASCYKNLGWLYCKVELNQQLLQAGDHCDRNLHVNFSVCKFQLFNAVKSLAQARQHGAESKPKPWLEQSKMVINSIIEWASEQMSLFSISQSPLLQYVSEAFENADVPPTSRLLAFKSYADALFKEAHKEAFG
ncbi:hypothetical protein GOP47_0013645 [Adiantum capillus-veneris]|uniref:Uncharacterized protein n=1 Tax=Adiantum capillus-veneris TaxID=13818 RepID=A0A9D4ZDL1_ADICA|nr:hypothetical protein GOP47_0013645 [Adiantum capillus-veneris]